MIGTLLDVVCQTTGMGFAAVARVTQDRWIACSVRDEIQFGLVPGSELPVETTICNEIRDSQQAVIIDHVAESETFCQHPTPLLYGFQSYISFPIFLKNGEFFGTLCAIDPSPAQLDNAKVKGLFSLFADLIAFHLQQLELLEQSQQTLAEQVLAVQQLEESEARFRLMAEGTSILIAVGDEAGNAVYFNRAWTTLTGRPMADLLQLGWIDLVHPDDREGYVNLYLDAFKVLASFSGEFRVSDSEGAYHWLLAESVPRFQSDGTFAGYISSCINITSRKLIEAEQTQSRLGLERAFEQARLSKEAAHLGTFDMDLLDGTMIWDERCRLLFGISHQNAVSFESDFIARLHPQDQKRIVNVIQGVFIKSVSNGDYDVEYRTIGAEDQQIRWVRAKGKVYFDEQDTPVRFIGSVLDITEQVNAVQKIEDMVAQRTNELNVANEQLVAANDLLTRSNEHLQRFAHVASHDLQEPLRKIQQFSDILKTEHAAALGNELVYLERMQEAAGRMSNLIRDLLSYSQISAHTVLKEPISLQQVVNQVLIDLELLIEETGAQITVDSLPSVIGDASQLTHLFQNLLSNALKFRRPGIAPVIRLQARLVLHADLPVGVKPVQLTHSYHQLDVVDNGIGFENQYAQRIFGAFQRLHRKHEYAGTGIGLSISERVVASHGGAITASSQPGQGATFSIYLPI